MKTIKIVGMIHEFGDIEQTNEEVEVKYGLEPGFILKKTGVKKRHRWSEDQLETPLPLAAFSCVGTLAHDLGMRTNDIVKNVGAIFGSSNIMTLPSQTHQFARWGLFKDKMIAHINYGCGGYFAAIELMHTWLMGQKEGTRALLVLMDHPSSMVNRYETESLFSDALHVSLWSNTDSDPGYVVKKPFSAMADGDIRALSIDDGAWKMDGSAITKFVRKVPDMIGDRMGITDLRDFDIVPHQPNVRLLETLERDYGMPFYKEVVREHGNPTCSGTMIALEKFLQESQSTKPILAMGFGDSLSYGAMIIRR